jgi:hypothetical protein
MVIPEALMTEWLIRMTSELSLRIPTVFTPPPEALSTINLMSYLTAVHVHDQGVIMEFGQLEFMLLGPEVPLIGFVLPRCALTYDPDPHRIPYPPLFTVVTFGCWMYVVGLSSPRLTPEFQYTLTPFPVLPLIVLSAIFAWESLLTLTPSNPLFAMVLPAMRALDTSPTTIPWPPLLWIVFGLGVSLGKYG